MSKPVLLDQTQQQQLFRMLRAQGLTHAEIAQRCGVPVHRVSNVLAGRVKGAPTPRTDKGRSRNPHTALVVALARDVYFQQGKMKRNLSACIDVALNRAMLEHGIVIPKGTVQGHVYKAFRQERWDIQFSSLKNQHAFQAYLPKLTHDYWNNLQYNDFWVIDGRKSDLWTVDESTGEIFMPQGFYIMELKTARYLHVSIGRESFTASQVMQIMIETAVQHGVPNLGILCDNGMEQVGQDNILAMEQFWPVEIIQLYRQGSGVRGFHDVYPGAISPVITSLPRIPTEFGKARLERSFGFLQSRLDAFIAGHGYQGGSRFDVVHTTLARTPRKDRTFLTFGDYQRFMVWFLTSDQPHNGLLPYSQIERPKMLQGLTHETGLVPTINNAVDYCMQSFQRAAIPEENYFRLLYYALPKYEGKSVRKIHQVEFQHNKRQYVYHCTQIDYTMVGRKVDVVPDPDDDTRAAIFYNGQLIGIARDITRSRITIGEKKELVSHIRRHAVAQVRSDSAQHKQRVMDAPAEVTPDYLQPVRMHIDGVDTDAVLYAAYDEMQQDDISTETADILERIKNHL